MRGTRATTQPASRPAADATAVYTRLSELTAIYTRISMDRQEGAGVRDQAEDCMELARRKGWDHVLHFPDNDVSASQYARKKRPQYRAMLAKVRAGEIRRIVVAHLDRLYRQPKELEELIDLADAGNIEIVSVHSGPLDLGTSDGRAMARILIAIAAKSSEDTSRRVLRAKRRAREAGQATGGPRPFGWKRITVTDRDGTTRETWDPMAHDEAEADLIRKATEDVIAGASLTEIARRWNAAGIPQPQGSKSPNRPSTDTEPRWNEVVVRLILTSPRNAGLMPHYQRTIVEGKMTSRWTVTAEGQAAWPAIVDRAKWERCREVLSNRAPRWLHPRRRSLLTSLLICGICGARMVRDSTRNAAGHRAIWRCPHHVGSVGADGKKSCGRIGIDAAHLEEHVRDSLFSWADGTDLAQLVESRAQDHHKAKELAAQLADTDRKLSNAADSHAAGRLSLRAYEQIASRLEAQQRELQGQIGRTVNSSVMIRYIARPGALEREWEHLSEDVRRAAIKETIGSFVILPAPKLGQAPFDRSRVVPIAGFVPLRMRPAHD